MRILSRVHLSFRLAWAFAFTALICAFAIPAFAQPPSSTTWTPIGPAPLGRIAGGNVNTNVSGRIAGIGAHPSDPNTIYIAAAGGGVWKSIDGGVSWTPMTDAEASLSMGAIAVAPSNPNVIYAGTGEANNSGDSNYGRGILVSGDGGSTWTLTTAGGKFDRLTTSKIAVDPTNASIAYAAMADFANNGVCCNNTGIWKTIDGGTTWINTTSATLTQQAPYSDVVIDPNNSSIVYMAIGNPFGGSIDQSSNGLYQSTNGGSTWSLLTAAPHGVTTGRFAIAMSKANSQVIYVSTSNPFNFSVLSVVRSDNGGATFTTVTPPNYMDGQGWYDTAIAVDPSDAGIVYVAGSAGGNSILRSINSGVNWTDIHIGGAPNNSTPHVDHHALTFDANGKVLDGNDGGIWRLDTPPTSWSDLNGNLATLQFQGIGLHPTDPNKAIAGSQDNGTELYTGGLVWQETDGGDGGFAKFSQTNGNRVYHIAPVGSFGTASFFRRSDNGGMTWASKTGGIINANTFLFYPPFVVDPLDGNRLLTAGDRVFASTNGADVWFAISSPGANGWPANVQVQAIGFSQSDVNTVYAATGLNNVYMTTNGGGSWVNRPITANPGKTIQDLQVDPLNAQIVYAVFNDFGGGKVFRSANGGTSWADISGNLPDLPLWSMQLDPNSASTYYLGADDGVYRTTNGGTTWTRFGAGLPYAQVFQIELSGNLQILAAATHGRGAWEILTPSAPAVVSYSVLFGSQSFNLIGSSRTRLPWQISAIQVVFSEPITSGDVNSLTGVTPTGFSGLGTNTLTWTINPVSIGAFTTSLLGTGPDALKDAADNAIATFNQNFKVLQGDFNDNGIVQSSDMVGVNNARSAPYNIFADINGDGVVDINDVQLVRSKIGTSQP